MSEGGRFGVLPLRTVYYLYVVRNSVNEKLYVGLTGTSIEQRWRGHKCAALTLGSNSPLHCAIRKYGSDAFSIETVNIFGTFEECAEAEINAIAFLKEEGIKNYNAHSGGTTGYAIPAHRKEEWRGLLKKARVGRKPALGMQHTEENKAFFGECGRARWDKYGRYPPEVLSYSFLEAHRLYGISKTHYYRLKKQQAHA